jgi:hypothetical protein
VLGGGAIPVADVPTWTLVFTPILGLLGGLAVALVAPWAESITRKDQLKGYKRNIYRNFLDHGYWYLHPEEDDKEKKWRAVRYVADWHRIQLITNDADVEALIKDIREPETFSDEIAETLLPAFKKEIGTGGLKEPGQS